MVQQIRFNKDNAIDYILSKIPEYNGSWQEHLEYWKDEDKRSVGLDIGNFLDFTIEKIEQRRYELLSKIFSLIEELIEYGDEDIDYAVTMMFLEDLLSVSEHRVDTVSHKIFLPLLGPKSQKFCRELSPGIF